MERDFSFLEIFWGKNEQISDIISQCDFPLGIQIKHETSVMAKQSEQGQNDIKHVKCLFQMCYVCYVYVYLFWDIL